MMNPSSNNNSNSNININRPNNDNNGSNSNQNHNHNRSNGNSNNTYHYNNSATATTTITDTNRSTNADHNEVRPILKLRHHRQPNKVKWTDETIDNEHMNKKKTKICCIFHPADGESCSSSESESDNSDDEPQGGDINNIGPNAYEKQPHYKTS